MALSGCPRLSGASWLKLEPLPSPQPGEGSFLQSENLMRLGPSSSQWGLKMGDCSVHGQLRSLGVGQLAFPATDVSGWHLSSDSLLV